MPPGSQFSGVGRDSVQSREAGPRGSYASQTYAGQVVEQPFVSSRQDIDSFTFLNDTLPCSVAAQSRLEGHLSDIPPLQPARPERLGSPFAFESRPSGLAQSPLPPLLDSSVPIENAMNVEDPCDEYLKTIVWWGELHRNLLSLQRSYPARDPHSSLRGFLRIGSCPGIDCRFRQLSL